MQKLGFDAHLSFAPYGQVFQSLFEGGDLRSHREGVNVVFVRRSDILGGRDAIRAAADLRSALESCVAATALPHVVVVCPSVALDSALERDADRELATELGRASGVDVVTAEEIRALYPVDDVLDAYTEAEAKIPYTETYFAALGTFLARRIRVAVRAPKKVILVDCDDTLWGGVVGEAGVDGVVIDAPRVALQRFLLEERASGVLLGVVSKNDEPDVFAVFDRRPEMLLRREHLTTWRINWSPKSQNIVDIARELELGVDSFVFLDDDAFVCAEARDVCPGLVAVQLPEDPDRIPELLRGLWVLDRGRVTQEDRRRAEEYRVRGEREHARKTMSHEDFIASLGLEVRFAPLEEGEVPRASQLTMRTNQFNATTVRRSEAAVKAIVVEGREVHAVEVRDRFGDYGLTGLVVFEVAAQRLVIETLLLSCRVLGRGVEEHVLRELSRLAAIRGATEVVVPFVETPKNGVYAAFYRGLAGTRQARIAGGEETILSLEAAAHVSGTKPVAEEAREREPRQPDGDVESIDHRAIALDFSTAGAVLKAIGGGRAASERPAGSVFDELFAMWRDVLGVPEIGPDDDLFDFGGDSVVAIRLLGRVRERFGVEVPLHEVFEDPTARGLARRVEDRTKDRVAASAPRASAIAEETDGRLPLSFGQERFWFLTKLKAGTELDHVPWVARLRGPVDPAALERALVAIVRRHEALRTVLEEEDGAPRGRVADVALHLERHDVRSRADGEREAAARELASRVVRRPFELSTGPLVRAALVELGPADHLFVLVVHHVATDGWSTGVLLRDLGALYRGESLAALPTQYADFVRWQRSLEPLFQKQLVFWKERLTAAPPRLDLPTDRPRPPMRRSRGKARRFAIAEDIGGRALAFAHARGVTPFMVILAAIDVLLSRWSGQRDVVVGTPQAGRSLPEHEELVGFFVNTLALRTSLEDDPSFSELVRRVREVTLSALDHHDVPFQRVIEELNPVRDTSRTPIFQVLFAHQNTPATRLDLPGVTVEVEAFRSESEAWLNAAAFDLGFRTAERDGRIEDCFVEYDADLFDDETIARMTAHLVTILDRAVAHPEMPVSQLPLMTESELRRVLVEPNATALDLRLDTSVVDLIEAQVDRTPDAIALVFAGGGAAEDDELTYRELDDRANRLAFRLRALELGRDARVAVFVDRGAATVVAALAVLKAGGVYVPLDPGQPRERVRFMLASADVRAVLASAAHEDELPRDVVSVRVDEPAADLAERVGARIHPLDLAYAIFTSGSTGRPKAVGISHAALSHHMQWMVRQFDFGPADRVVQRTATTFDASVWELFAPLVCGGAVIVAKSSADPEALCAALSRGRATVLQCVPSLLGVLVEDEGFARAASTLRLVFCGGEAYPASLRDALRRVSAALPVNLYGPTECTIDSTFSVCESGAVTLGRPVANTTAYVLDDAYAPVPIGVRGELYVGGVQLARGYLDQPSLTAERFMPDPFCAEPGARMYRTGDIVRRLADGTLEYLGRTDHQVKLRGYRIELGEIEANLAACPGVRRAAALVREDRAGDRRLVAYVESSSATADALRERLREALPDYMLPSAIVVLAELPLTTSGKIDRKALPAPDLTLAAAEFVAPRSATEQLVVDVWKEVLGVDRVGMRDDFFALGGHSLLAVRMISRLRRASGVEASASAVFEAPTAGELARYLDRTTASASDGAEGWEDPIPVTSTREAALDGARDLSCANDVTLAWSRARAPAAFFKFGLVLRSRGALDRSALEAAIVDVLCDHDVLRWTYDTSRSKLDVLDAKAICPVLVDVGAASDIEAPIDGAVQEAIRRPFLLNGEALTRIHLVRASDREHALLLECHPLVNDPPGMELLASEIEARYEARLAGAPSSPRGGPQYRDYARWQRDGFAGEGSARALAARAHLAKAHPVTLACRGERHDAPSLESVDASFALSAESFDRLRAFCRAHSVTPYVLFLAVVGLVAECGSGQRAATIAALVDTRHQRRALAKMLGYFFNQIFCHTSSDGAVTFADLLARARSSAAEGLAFADVPSALALGDPGVLDSAPYRVLINGPNLGEWSSENVAGLAIARRQAGLKGPRSELVFSGWQREGRLLCAVLGASDVFTQPAVRALADAFQFLLTDLDPERPVAELRARVLQFLAQA